jgi:hypothetical protein
MAERFVDHFGPYPTTRHIPVNGGSVCQKGEIIGIDAQGMARPGALIATGYVRTRGVAVNTVNATGLVDSDLAVMVEPGIHGPFTNNGSSIAIQDCGSPCYVVDANSVDLSSATNTRALAGTIERVTSRGVYVNFA